VKTFIENSKKKTKSSTLFFKSISKKYNTSFFYHGKRSRTITKEVLSVIIDMIFADKKN